MSGRRRDDTYVTYREAVEMFATKSDIVALTARVDALVPRSEMKLRWDMEDNERKELYAKVGTLMDARVPAWILSIAGPIIAVIGSYVIPHLGKP
jgi:hypothetical protein